MVKIQFDDSSHKYKISGNFDFADGGITVFDPEDFTPRKQIIFGWYEIPDNIHLCNVGQDEIELNELVAKKLKQDFLKLLNGEKSFFARNLFIGIKPNVKPENIHATDVYKYDEKFSLLINNEVVDLNDDLSVTEAFKIRDWLRSNIKRILEIIYK